MIMHPLFHGIQGVSGSIPLISTKSVENHWFSGLGGGDKRDRTADLLNAMEERVHIYEYLCAKWSKQSNILR